MHPHVYGAHTAIDERIEARISRKHGPYGAHDQRKEREAKQLDEHAVDILDLGRAHALAISNSSDGRQDEEESRPVDVILGRFFLHEIDPRVVFEFPDRDPAAGRVVGHQEHEDNQLGESDKLADLVAIVGQPTQKDLLEYQVELDEQPVPVHESQQFEVVDAATLQGHKARQCGRTIQEKVGPEVVPLNFFQLLVDLLPLLDSLVLGGLEKLLEARLAVITGVDVGRQLQEVEKDVDRKGYVDKHLEGPKLLSDV